MLKIGRALLSVSDKENLIPLAEALSKAGAELVATGKTASLLKEHGLRVTPIESISGNPEAFGGRMKTLSFPVLSGVLYRRSESGDLKDVQKLSVPAIDCVVVNFYPFEKALEEGGKSRAELIEQIDIGGPTLVRAAAKNAPDVLVLTDPRHYDSVISELNEKKAISKETALFQAKLAWELVLKYDSAIAREMGMRATRKLRYGENPHQKALLETDPDSPIDWSGDLTKTELSYNNILDLSAAYGLASDLLSCLHEHTGVVIVKHNNPCGVAFVPKSQTGAQKLALLRAWEGDPVSAFGGVLVFTDPIGEDAAGWLSEKFIELVGAPGLTADSPGFKSLMQKRKNLKAARIDRFGGEPKETMVVVPGGRIFQTADLGVGAEHETLKSVTEKPFPKEREDLARFGISISKSLKSNALAIVRELLGIPGAYQLVGTGQGQPNRVEALERLALPRAQSVLRESGGALKDCILVSDAFFPFRDTVDIAKNAGVRMIVQPGGSIKDAESIEAANQGGIAMAFTGRRHFRH